MVKGEKASLGEGDIEDTNQRIKDEGKKKSKEDKKNKDWDRSMSLNFALNTLNHSHLQSNPPNPPLLKGGEGGITITY